MLCAPMCRMATKTTQVGKYTIPAGTIVATPLFAIQNTVHNWERPEEFMPERWLDVPLHWQHAAVRSDTLQHLSTALCQAAKTALQPAPGG